MSKKTKTNQPTHGYKYHGMWGLKKYMSVEEERQ